MCMNNECPSKETCYRFKAEPNKHRQSYQNYKVKKGDNKCDSYWEFKEKQKWQK